MRPGCYLYTIPRNLCYSLAMQKTTIIEVDELTGTDQVTIRPEEDNLVISIRDDTTDQLIIKLPQTLMDLIIHTAGEVQQYGRVSTKKQPQ